MRLTAVAVKNAKAKAKPYKLFDGEGLFLLVHPNGGKYWQLKYRYLDKEKTFSLGVYNEVSLPEAREMGRNARKELRGGIDPSAARKAAKRIAKAELENNFKAVAYDWHEKRKHLWTPRHSAKILRMLEQGVFAILGEKAITQISPPELLSVLRKIEERGFAYSAHRTQQIVSQIFRYAVATGKMERDITVDLRGALMPSRKEHYRRLSQNELPEFLNKLEGYDGESQTQIAVKLLILTFVRTIELRGAKWTEIDFTKAEWRIPAERMKMRIEHIVPLSKQALALFHEQRFATGNHEHVFPNRNRPLTYISENTILYAIYRLGFHNRATAHGFRGTASTILNESGFNSDVIERQLAHGERNQVRASYNHAQYLAERRKMMQWWADYIEGIRS